MKTTTITAQFVADAKSGAKQRRFRNILANSGQVMESGEVRDIANLYVMGYDGELYRIADLNKDPEAQTERYSVKAQADHGEIVDGEIVPTIEKQFGSCRVWLEEDGLHARMYFADSDPLGNQRRRQLLHRYGVVRGWLLRDWKRNHRTKRNSARDFDGTDRKRSAR